MKVQLTAIPPSETYQIPMCRKCNAPFQFWTPGGKGYGETWRQSCKCDPGDVTRYCSAEGTWATVSYNGEDTGKPIPRRCLFCGENMQPGEQAYLGTMGPYSHGGYAHPVCYQGWLDEMTKAEREAKEAKKGIAIAFWYLYWDASKKAPQTGHSDSNVRLIPNDLPNFPEGSVVYEQYRKPFAMSYVDIPNHESAEEWWRQATSNENVAYELHWYKATPDGEKRGKAERSWKGKEFSRVEAEARKMEWDAQRSQGY